MSIQRTPKHEGKRQSWFEEFRRELRTAILQYFLAACVAVGFALVGMWMLATPAHRAHSAETLAIFLQAAAAATTAFSAAWSWRAAKFTKRALAAEKRAYAKLRIMEELVSTADAENDLARSGALLRLKRELVESELSSLAASQKEFASTAQEQARVPRELDYLVFIDQSKRSQRNQGARSATLSGIAG